MGKRKSSAKPPPKKAAAKLEEQFNCPFCNSSQTVYCQMDWEMSRGTVSCVSCLESFTSNIHHLSEPIDVYHDWLDECEKQNT
ncbi:transcription elongation factor 1 [Scenedesmus sp. NREL 46B-D3]|nr:transcription elongation factor 1 [Scenedesmus sp. NREL 46B-D3]